MTPSTVADLARQLQSGALIPYLGPDMLSLCPQPTGVPADPLTLATQMTAKVSVPHKIRKRLTQAAQFIENFKHRKSLVQLMDAAFAASPTPSPLHRALAASGTGLWVDTWYDNTLATAVAEARPEGGWVQVQGLAQSEHFGRWCGAYDSHGQSLAELPATTSTLAPMLYQPLGSSSPASNYLVSDSDHVEVLTEIDIQTPIPAAVQAWRTGRSFLFIGCRFDDQLTRSFARQIMKRSSDQHWAVMPFEPTRMEARFLQEQGITRIATPLADFAAELVLALEATATEPALAA